MNNWSVINRSVINSLLMSERIMRELHFSKLSKAVNNLQADSHIQTLPNLMAKFRFIQIIIGISE